MAVQTPEQLVHGGGGLAASGLKDVVCQAFREAVDEHCSKPKGQRGSFNNKFYDKLRRHNPDLAGRIQREVPVVFGGAAGSAGQLAANLTNAPGPAGAAANAVLAAHQAGVRALAGPGATAVTGALANPRIPGGPWGVVGLAAMEGLRRGAPLFDRLKFALFRLMNRGVRVKFPDGLIGRQVIEIKGPGDTMSKGQAKDYQAFSKPDPPIVPSCESCAPANCVNKKTANGGCK